MIVGQYLQESVNAYYPNAIMIDAMKVWSLPEKKKDMLPEICANGEYFGQLKKDGNWYEFVTTEDNQYLFSRNESVETGLLTEKLDNVPHIRESLKALPKDTIVIGEIYYPGGNSNDVRKVMGCLPTKAIERQETMGLIKFYIHDIIFFNGISLLEKGAEARYKFLKVVYEKFDLKKYDFLELAEVYYDNLYERIAKALEDGEEGMVLKKKDAIYSPGRKPAWSAIKVKQVDYADVLCTGFEAATIEYEGEDPDSWEYCATFKRSSVDSDDWVCVEKFNKPLKEVSVIKSPLYKTIPVTKLFFHDWCGSITIGAYDNQGNIIDIGTVSSGLSDEDREKFKNNPNDYIGQVCMVQVMQKFDNALRHPIFKGFRDDKNAKECTLESIFN